MDDDASVATDARFDRAVMERVHADVEPPARADVGWLYDPDEWLTAHASALDEPERRLEEARHDAQKWGLIGRGVERWRVE